jgi:hypothetical protein
MQEVVSKHSVELEQRKNISISGVESVAAFSENRIALALKDGERMYVVGLELKITAFSKTSGQFTAEGQITGISYGGKSFASKLFR